MDDGMTMTLLMVAAVDQLEAASTWLGGLSDKATNYVQAVQSGSSLVIAILCQQFYRSSSILPVKSTSTLSFQGWCNRMGDYNTV